MKEKLPSLSKQKIKQTFNNYESNYKKKKGEKRTLFKFKRYTISY